MRQFRIVIGLSLSYSLRFFLFRFKIVTFRRPCKTNISETQTWEWICTQNTYILGLNILLHGFTLQIPRNYQFGYANHVRRSSVKFGGEKIFVGEAWALGATPLRNKLGRVGRLSKMKQALCLMLLVTRDEIETSRCLCFMNFHQSTSSSKFIINLCDNL